MASQRRAPRAAANPRNAAIAIVPPPIPVPAIRG
jgi:hypothetical protein